MQLCFRADFNEIPGYTYNNWQHYYITLTHAALYYMSKTSIADKATFTTLSVTLKCVN